MEVSLHFRFLRALFPLLAIRQRRRFENALRDPKKAQERVLGEILTLTKRYRLPESPTDYSSYPLDQSWTTESVKFYETTSGNSGKKKPIPYTPSLLKSFQAMFLLWVDDILKYRKLETGKLFISISPKLESMGMNSDLDYLNPWMRFLLSPMISAAPADFIAQDGPEFFRKIAARLLADTKLESISVWSPTYLISLLEFIHQHSDAWAIDAATKAKIQKQNWYAVWPHLKFISCWVDGSSKWSAQHLKDLLPNVVIQGKGLLATEGPMTVPWTQAMGCVPLWTEVYLEFIDDSGQLLPLYTMKPQQEGEIVLSTKGGLLRYRIGDIVRCTHLYQQTPVLKFIRRAGETSDLVGEKLDASILNDVFADLPRGKWLMVANIDHYVFVSDFKIRAMEIEDRLRKAFHYGLARELNQLRPVEVKFVPELVNNLASYYADRKIKVGDIKERLLWGDGEILNYLDSAESPDSFL